MLFRALLDFSVTFLEYLLSVISVQFMSQTVKSNRDNIAMVDVFCSEIAAQFQPQLMNELDLLLRQPWLMGAEVKVVNLAIWVYHSKRDRVLRLVGQFLPGLAHEFGLLLWSHHR